MSRAAAFTLATAAAATVLAGCAPGGGQAGGCATDRPLDGGTPVCVPVTWYGPPDNDPPGSRIIAHPGPPPRHARAGGAGTYADPITFATEYPAAYPVGSRIYIPLLRKYFVREDDCACRHGAGHVDLWMAAGLTDRRVLACENSAEINGRQTILTDPAPDLPVDTTPVYHDGRCQP